MHATNSDMLLETLIARTIGDESGFAMSALLAAPIPAGMIRYMHAEIVNRLAEDLSRAPHFARVASPTAGPDPVRDALLTHAAGQYILPREEFLEMLGNAGRFTENYLCRPRWTLASFLFHDQPAITTEMLLRKLEYIADYAYLPRLIRRMVTQSGKQAIAANECTTMIARIDDAVVREHSPRELALLARPIFQFFLLSPDVVQQPITLRALLLFLDDKQMENLRKYAEGVWHIRGKSEITLEEFAALSEDFASGVPGPAPQTVSEAQQKDPVAGSIITAPAPPDGSASDAQADVVPEPADPPPESPLQEMPFAPPPDDTAVQPSIVQESLSFTEAAPPETPAAEAAAPVPTDNAPELAEPGGEGPVTPDAVPQEQAAIPPPNTLETMIPGDLRRRFISVICGKDAEFYDLVIARLDEMHSWPEASAYIRELFEINSIDPFNETAVTFTDIVQKRCDRQREGAQ